LQIFLLTPIEHESIPSSIAAFVVELQRTKPPGRIGEQQEASITKKGNEKGDAISVPFLALAHAQITDGAKSECLYPADEMPDCIFPQEKCHVNDSCPSTSALILL
jgi:hypothetical protein